MEQWKSHSNASVRRKIEQANPDSTLYDYGRLNEFKQTEVRAIVNYDLSDKWSIQLGSLFQRKSAVHKSDFDKFAWERNIYHSPLWLKYNIDP